MVALRDELIAAGHAVWHDLKDMGAGQWWDRLEVDAAVQSLVALPNGRLVVADQLGRNG